MAAVSGSSINNLSCLYRTANNNDAEYFDRATAENKLIKQLFFMAAEIGKEAKVKNVTDFTHRFVALHNRHTPLLTRIQNFIRSLETFVWPTGFAPNENQKIRQLITFLEKMMSPTVTEAISTDAEATSSSTVTEDERKASPIVSATQDALKKQPLYGYIYSGFQWLATTQLGQTVEPLVTWVGDTAPVVWMAETTPVKMTRDYITAPIPEEESSSSTTISNQ